MRNRALWIERLPIATDRPLLAIGATMLLVIAAFALRWVVGSALPPGFPFVTFFPAVILASALFGARMGALSGIVCGLLAWYFFLGDGSFAVSRSIVAAIAFYTLVVATDVAILHWMQHANAKLAREREANRALAETGTLLFHELQHRVSNNLQVAAGLIALQKRRVSDEDARAALDEASQRVALIGSISRQLYDAGGSTRRMGEFLTPLCHDVVAASGRSGISVAIDVDPLVTVSADSAIPLALIVAEAVANAIEHGFARRDSGTIEVVVGRDSDKHIRVEVRDDGHGLPDGFAIDQSDSLGLRIARTLAAQLQGSFDLLPGQGAIARLTLPA